MALVNMQRSKEEIKEASTPAESSEDAPRYPWGLALSLDDDSLTKLGFTDPPAVGTVLTITARVEVCSSRQYQTLGAESEMSSDWQITDMAATMGDPSNKDHKDLYPNSKMQ
jgi:hypothetical protein